MSSRQDSLAQLARARLVSVAKDRFSIRLVLSGIALALVWRLPQSGDLVGLACLAALPFLLVAGVWGLQHFRPRPDLPRPRPESLNRQDAKSAKRERKSFRRD